MNKALFDKIIQLQEDFQNDPDHRQLLAEQEILSAEFLKQLDTMNDAQRNAVLDYCGLMIEMHLRTLTYCMQQDQ